MSSAARAASIHARLLNGARERREEFNLTLGRYAVERFLYRISVSDARDQFVLRGALLFDLWFDAPHRPTRDADFLGFGEKHADALTETIRAARRSAHGQLLRAARTGAGGGVGVQVRRRRLGRA